MDQTCLDQPQNQHIPEIIMIVYLITRFISLEILRTAFKFHFLLQGEYIKCMFLY